MGENVREGRASLCAAIGAADADARCGASRSYYICPVPECKWSGSSRSRHAKSRRACSAVPIAFRYQPGADVGKMVRVALESTAVLTSASQEAEAAAATEAATEGTQVQNLPTAPPAYPSTAEPFAEPPARSAAVGVVAQPPIASAPAMPPDNMTRTVEDTEQQPSLKRARTDDRAASATANNLAAAASASAATVTAGPATAVGATTEIEPVPTYHYVVPTGVPESPVDPPSAPVNLPRASVEPPRAAPAPTQTTRVAHASVTAAQVVLPNLGSAAVAPSRASS